MLVRGCVELGFSRLRGRLSNHSPFSLVLIQSSSICLLVSIRFLLLLLLSHSSSPSPSSLRSSTTEIKLLLSCIIKPSVHYLHTAIITAREEETEGESVHPFISPSF